ALELLLGQECDQVAGERTMAVREVVARRGREVVDVLRPAASVRLGVRDSGQPVGLEGLQVAQRSLLGNLEVRGDLAERGVPSGLEEGEDALAPGVHELNGTSFSTWKLK